MRKASLFTIFLIVFIDLMGFGIVLPNLQLYGQRFGIESYFALTLIGASYSFCQFIFAPILGKWSDRIGRRPVLLVSQAGTLIGFLILFAAHFFEKGYGATGVILIFASRIVDGISGGNISTAQAYIADITTPENRSKGYGLIGAAFGIGFMFGPAIGGVVAYYFGLEWVPIAAAIFSVTALALTYRILPESLDPEHRTPPEELRRYTAGTIIRALARPRIGPMIVMGFVNGFAFAGMEQTYSLLIRYRIYARVTDILKPDVIDETARRASRGSGLLFFMIGIILAGVQGGLIHKLTRKFGEAKLLIVGPLLIAIGMFIVAADVPGIISNLTSWRPLPETDKWQWNWLHLSSWAIMWSGFFIGSAFLALGSSLFNPSLQSLVSRHAARNEQGTILGSMQGMASLARATGPVAAGLLFEYVMPGTRYQGSAPYWLSGAMCLGVVFWAVAIRKQLIPPAMEAQAVQESGEAMESVQLMD
jgi:MFS transporter, DHA1 family, tetracycline resistance protein